jgi:hypothetical protein
VLFASFFLQGILDRVTWMRVRQVHGDGGNPSQDEVKYAFSCIEKGG